MNYPIDTNYCDVYRGFEIGYNVKKHGEEYYYTSYIMIDSQVRVSIQLTSSPQSAIDEAKYYIDEHLESLSLPKIKTWGGSRPGSGQPSPWGKGKTKPVRLPVQLAENVKDVKFFLEAMDSYLEEWETICNDSASRSASGQPSARFENVAKLVSDLRQLQSELLDKEWIN